MYARLLTHDRRFRALVCIVPPNVHKLSGSRDVIGRLEDVATATVVVVDVVVNDGQNVANTVSDLISLTSIRIYSGLQFSNTIMQIAYNCISLVDLFG